MTALDSDTLLIDRVRHCAAAKVRPFFDHPQMRLTSALVVVDFELQLCLAAVAPYANIDDLTKAVIVYDGDADIPIFNIHGLLAG